MTLLPEVVPGVHRCANPNCSNEFVRASKRGRPQLFCKPACRTEAAKIQQRLKTGVTTVDFYKSGRKLNPGRS